MAEEIVMQPWEDQILTAGDWAAIFNAHDSPHLKSPGVLADTVKFIAKAKCRPLTAQEKLEALGFRHSCGGGVIGCRCLENWEQAREMAQPDYDLQNFLT